MGKILRYSIADLLRSRWSYVYFLFYLVLGFTLLFLNNSVSKAIITLMNIIIVLTPLIGTVFGIMYQYNSQEFTTMLLALPIRRTKVFIGQYIGLSLSLTLSLVLGLGIPFAIYGLVGSAEIWNFSILLLIGSFLTFIFVALASNIAISNTNRIKGFGYAILLWLFLAVIYDGIFLTLLVHFDDYPIDKFALVSTMFNPIDLSRMLILLKLDISALLGYTGAVFQKFFGTSSGMVIAFSVLSLWVIFPLLLYIRKVGRKDF
jgi:Cu-processing system permease protein